MRPVWIPGTTSAVAQGSRERRCLGELTLPRTRQQVQHRANSRMAMNSVGSNINRLFPTESVTGPELRCDGTCGRLLRDANGKQVLEDVCASRRSCPHVFCAKCLLAGTVHSAREGTVFMCPKCVDPQDKPRVSWDVRSLQAGAQSTPARAQDGPGKKRKGPEEVGTCVYKVEKGGWGSRRPEDAIFLPEAARRFHAEPVSDKERGKTGVVCVLSHGQEGIITRSCRLSENSDSESEETVGKTLALLGRILRVTIVKSAAAGFGAARQSVQNLVDFESIVKSAMYDTSHLVMFMRNLCSPNVSSFLAFCFFAFCSRATSCFGRRRQGSVTFTQPGLCQTMRFLQISFSSGCRFDRSFGCSGSGTRYQIFTSRWSPSPLLSITCTAQAVPWSCFRAFFVLRRALRSRFAGTR